MAEAWIAHIHAGGCDACLREWEVAWLEAAGRGRRGTTDFGAASVLVVTGMPNELGVEPLALLLGAWAADGAGALLLVGDCAIHGGLWARLGAPGVPGGVAVDSLPPAIRIVRVPGDPPGPAAILEGLTTAINALG
jgi:Ni,Fe-hydrogenase III small subunit